MSAISDFKEHMSTPSVHLSTSTKSAEPQADLELNLKRDISWNPSYEWPCTLYNVDYLIDILGESFDVLRPEYRYGNWTAYLSRDPELEA